MMKLDGSPAIRTMVIAPHMDDEVLGAGGLIRKRICCRDEVMVLTCFDRKYKFKDGDLDSVMKAAEKTRKQKADFDEARKVLGYKQHDHRLLEEGEPGKTGYYELLDVIEHYMKVWEPTEIVIPGRYDLNQDHRHLNEVCRIALRADNRHMPHGPIRRVLEMISHDRLIQADADYAVALTEPMMNTVLSAWSRYEDEQRDNPHVRSQRNMMARYQYWGAQFGFALAEPFRLLFAVE